MGLSSAIQIGRTALSASQLGIQAASNNLANAATPGYNRRVVDLRSIAGEGSAGATQIGLGVEVGAIRRQVDEALLSRLNTAVGDESAADQRLQILSQIENNLNELSDGDLSTELSSFFNAWSELANGTESSALVIEQGERLAGFLRRTRDDLVLQRNSLDDSLDAQVARADELLTEVARLNGAITQAEVDLSQANALRDQRDQLVRELSEYLDVTTITRETGAVDVLVGSTPLVQGSRSRGIEVKKETRGSLIEINVVVKADGERLDADTGSISALLTGRDSSINRTIADIDSLASSLIFEINKVHSTGTNQSGLTSASSTRSLAAGDIATALNDPAHATLGGLAFGAFNGGFDIIVTDSATGATTTTRIDVDLDGIDATGASGFTDDTSAQDIAAALGGVAGIDASIGADGVLRVSAQSGVSFSFADDTSGALAVLGVNAYFTGEHAGDIGVDERLSSSPSSLTRGRLDANRVFIENGTSLAISDLQDAALASLGGRTAGAFWRDSVQRIGVETSSAKRTLESANVVREGLDAQRLALSGVNEDEEAVNLLSFQRQFQGAARVISTADQLLQELLALV